MKDHIIVAIEAIKSLIQWKMLQGKTNEVGIILFGCEVTSNPLNEAQGGYENIFQFAPIDRPNVDLIRKMVDISVNDNMTGDLIEGLIVGLDMLRQRTEKKKYNRKIYLITDGANPVEGAEDLPAVVEMMTNLEVELTVLGIGFRSKGSAPVGRKHTLVKDESQETEEEAGREGEVQYENEKMLLSIARATGGQVIASKNLPDMMASMHCKQANPRKLKMPLEITPSLTIRAQYFGKTSQARPPSMSKESKRAFDPTDPKSGKVTQDKTYRDPDQPDVEIDFEDRIKGFRYGKDYIPVTQDVEEAMKLMSDGASMKVLGFTDPSSIQRCYYMSTTQIVIGEIGNDKAAVAISALTRALKRQTQAAVVRFVRQKNADPQVGVLFPDENCSTYDRLVYEQLPFYEDLRNFTFPSFEGLKTGLAPSNFQDMAAARLIENMMLSKSGVDLLPLETVYNPALQRVHASMIARAIDPKCPLPEADKNVEGCLMPNKELLAWAKDALSGFSSAFEFKKVEVSKTKKRKTFWSDLDADGAEEKKVKEEEKEENEADKGITEVGTVTPVENFEAMINEGLPAKISDAISQMQTTIEKIITDGASAAYYKKALGCVKVLRSACIMHSEAANFNTFLRNLKGLFSKGPHGGFWDLLVDSETSLCTKSDDSSVDVTTAEASSFLRGEQEQEAPPPAKEEEDEEDLFDDMS